MTARTPAPRIPFRSPAMSDEMRLAAVTRFRDALKGRRSVRDFSAEPAPRAVIEAAVEAAASAPNGANMQPWYFAVVESPDIKRRIREAAEAEERAFYGGRAGDEWLDALAPFGTDAEKPFLESAPYLIVVFQQDYGLKPDGSREKHYYVRESVGIACGFLLAALQEAGLATLTHTPSPMGFLREVLGRPVNEKAVMIIVAGHPTADAAVPAITKKDFADICGFY